MKEKNKSIIDRLMYTYIRKIKKWMFCPACQDGKMRIDKTSTTWQCKECGYKLSAKKFEDDYVFWFCDECQTYLNNQDGFDEKSDKHICRICGYENDTTFNNVKGICLDCGKVIGEQDGALCAECKDIRKEKAKQWLIKGAKVAGTVAAVAGVAYLASKATDDDNDTNYNFSNDTEEDDEVYGLGEGNYPYCKTCGAKMTDFDGWAWYTCPECENSVRIIEGKETWHDEIFKSGNKQHHSDFELADFCHGGDLTED